MKHYSKTNMLSAMFAMSTFSAVASAQTMTPTKTAPVSASVSVDYASSYIFRGVTVNKDSAVQPGLELSFLENAAVGVWGNIPFDAAEGELEQELDAYASYTLPLGMASFTLGIIEYMYPEDDIDNDREIQFGIALDTILNPSLTAYAGIDGAIEDSEFYEFALGQDLYSQGELSFSLGGSLGYLDSDIGEDGLSYGMVTLGASYAMVNASANFIVETDEDVNDLEDQENFYLSVGTGYSF